MGNKWGADVQQAPAHAPDTSESFQTQPQSDADSDFRDNHQNPAL